MLQAFQVICTSSVVAAFTEAERREIAEWVMPLAEEKDTGVHEGLVFSFEAHGKLWNVVVDIGGRWLKILSKEEFESAVQDAVSRN